MQGVPDGEDDDNDFLYAKVSLPQVKKLVHEVRLLDFSGNGLIVRGLINKP